MKWIVGAASNKGASHDTNEDAILTEWVPGADGCALLMAVADGMGGLENGHAASATAVETLRQSIMATHHLDEEGLATAFVEAHAAISGLSLSESHEMRLGTTMVAAILKSDCFFIANVGDSRAYRLEGGLLKQLTSDHSVTAEQLSRGLLTRDEASKSPYRHLLTRYLGGEAPAPKVDIQQHQPLQPGESLLLCSDGLHSVLEEAEINDAVRVSEPGLAAHQLVELVRKRGIPDDVSVVLVKVRANDEGASDEQPSH